jgi:cytoskeletal protein CcmA (bactofilin family)
MSDKNGLPTTKHTLVEEGTEFKGTLSSKHPIVVMGTVEGDISGPSIHVTNSGVVAGNVKVKELRSSGEIAGDVEADAVHISGRVRNQTVIRARSLEVSVKSETGIQVVFGECELAIGDAPNKEAAIAAATAQPAAPAIAAPTVPTDEEPRGQAKQTRTNRPSEGWDGVLPAGAAGPARDEGTGKATTETETGGKRRRGTQPPPT